MRGRFWFGIIAALLLLGLVAGVGVMAYNAGVMQGMLVTNTAVTEGTTVPVAPFVTPWMMHRPFAFGFGFLACLVPFFFVLTFFALMRFVFRGPHYHRGWGGPGMYGKWNTEDGNLPPHIVEWHRKLHEQENTPPPAPAAPAA